MGFQKQFQSFYKRSKESVAVMEEKESCELSDSEIEDETDLGKKLRALDH